MSTQHSSPRTLKARRVLLSNPVVQADILNGIVRTAPPDQARACSALLTTSEPKPSIVCRNLCSAKSMTDIPQRYLMLECTHLYIPNHTMRSVFTFQTLI